jgi:hypothetical protein
MDLFDSKLTDFLGGNEHVYAKVLAFDLDLDTERRSRLVEAIVCGLVVLRYQCMFYRSITLVIRSATVTALAFLMQPSVSCSFRPADGVVVVPGTCTTTREYVSSGYWEMNPWEQKA